MGTKSNLHAPDAVTVRVPSLHNGISQQPPQVRLNNQVPYALNAVFSVVDGASKRPGSNFIYHFGTTFNNTTDNIRLHPIVRDNTESYVLLYGDISGSVFAVDVSTAHAASGAVNIQQATITISAAATTYLNQFNTTYSDRLRVLTVADSTFIVNTRVATGMTEQAGAFSAATVASPTELTTSVNHGLTSGQKIVIVGTGTSLATGTTPDITGSWVVTVTAVNKFTIPANVTAVAGITATWNRGVPDQTKMPVRMIRQNTYRAGSITGNSAVNPTVVTAPNHGLVTGQAVLISGVSGSSPSINGTFVATVTGTNTFTIPVNVTVAGTGGTFMGYAYFTLDVVSWSERESGDSVTNPGPSFITFGKTISEIAYFGNRFTVGASDRVCMSATDDLFNFFNANALNVVDSDPIDREVGERQTAEIEYFVSVRKALLIFTRGGEQYELTGSNDIVSTQSIVIRPTTRYKTTTTRPAIIDPLVFFYTEDESAAKMWQYSFDEVYAPSTAEETTGHVQDLIFLRDVNSPYARASMRTVVASPSLGVVVGLRTAFAYPAYSGSDLFVYKILFANNQKFQSAWTRFSIGDTNLIHDVCVLGSDLYMLRGYTLDGTYQTMLERLPLGSISSHRVT